MASTYVLEESVIERHLAVVEMSTLSVNGATPGMIKAIRVTREHCVSAAFTGHHLHPLWPLFRK